MRITVPVDGVVFTRPEKRARRRSSLRPSSVDPILVLVILRRAVVILSGKVLVWSVGQFGGLGFTSQSVALLFETEPISSVVIQIQDGRECVV